MPSTSSAPTTEMLGRLEVVRPWDGPVVNPPQGKWQSAFKRPAEAILSALALIATAPLLFLAVVLVKLTSRGPVFYTQVRLGQRGRPFTIYKIRTMLHNCEKLSGARWSTPGDPRVTPAGRLLRRTHVDELPQLWNVLRGDMSLIGPRPERPEFIPQLEQVIPRYQDRLLVRPGLSGLAQIQLPADTDLASVRRKLAHDLHYVQHLSFGMDCKIVIHTLGYLLGIPFLMINQFLSVPTGMLVEDSYLGMTLELASATQVQTIPRLRSA